ncbi:MAG: CehA/McbA family metallohydrolase, partial [Candidatus Woesearchaeota archaeon]
KYGTLHVHTGYSSQTGYDHDILTTEDNCPKETLNWHGYTVAELKEQALDLNVQWLSFTDHSYCLTSSEFNTIKSDCQNAQDSEFSCLWGEELSAVDDDASSTDEALCVALEVPPWKAAHLGAHGISNFISQSPAEKWCPNSPSAQSGINSINSENGLSIINHPYATNWDFVSIDGVSNYDGIEIWNGEWSNDDQESREFWVWGKLQEDEKVFVFGGTDTHDEVTTINYNLVRIDSLTHSDLEEGLKAGTNVVSNNGYVRIKAKTNTQDTWTEMGGELDANTDEVLTVRVRHNVENNCDLTVRRSEIGSYIEYYYLYEDISGFGYFDIDYPLPETGDYYFRAECIGSGGDYRAYTNPIWVNVLDPDCICTDWQPGSCGGGSCTSDQRQYTRTCTPSGCATETDCVYDSDCSDPGGPPTECEEPGYEFCIEGEYGNCDVSIALNLYENVNNIQWGTVNDAWDPYVIGEYAIGWKDVDAEQMYYDVDDPYNDCYYGGCDGEEIAGEGTRVTVTAPGTASHEVVLGYDDTPDWACWVWFWDFNPNYGADNPIYVLNCFDDDDCSANEYCDKGGNWDEWDCVNKKSDGQSCTSDNQCQSNYCDNDGVGLGDDNWCFTPYNTYFDGQETSYCEYSTNNGIVDCDERQVGDDLNKCLGISYYEEECGSICNYQDVTSVFECTETGCSCPQPLCDGLGTGSDITTCISGQTYFADKCTSTAAGEDRGDNICRSNSFASDCTGDSECNGVEAGTGGCNATCNYSPTAPTNPIILYPNGGENISIITIINWTQSMDPEGDYVRYFLQYSNNSGIDWYEIISNYGYENKLSDGPTEKNLTFIGNENKTVYIRIPKNAIITSTSLDIEGV